ncbi:hypothetical protein HPB52_017465 [Rhipicephalus sanguineus]|uniref:Amino acid transporter n=1 Tax=Rhipicephalus sanguineus TaxID=34632 RepID=A0A9D4ST29_RHISA|nr:hypothetical protein HPB52_017465 [Rhipicephalus sanguineus]
MSWSLVFLHKAGLVLRGAGYPDVPLLDGRYFPNGVVLLLSASIGRGDDLGEQAINVGAYTATVMAGLATHSLIVLPLIYYSFVRKNPLVFALHAFVTAFGTSDSGATLPVKFMCLDQNNKLDRRVTKFVALIVSAFKLPGTALYAAIGTIFISDLSGIELDFAHYLGHIVRSIPYHPHF